MSGLPITERTTTTPDAQAARPAVEAHRLGGRFMKYLTTTDHKVIANMYFVTVFCFFLLGGILALGIRAELASPGLDYLNYETFNQFFTMHGTIMLLMFATPLFAGFANAIVPLQLGAPDVAFPRLNAYTFWLYLREPAVLRLHDVPDRDPHRGEVLQLGGHHLERVLDVEHVDGVRHRLPGHVPVRRADGHHPGLPGPRLPRDGYLLRRGALPLRAVRYRGVRDVRRLLLLVAQVHRSMLNETWGKIHVWTLFVGFHTTFLVQHWLGVAGMQRRIADYGAWESFTFLNQVSTFGAFLLGASMLPFLWNAWTTRKTPKVTVNDPWGWGCSLEWATSCPPPRHNFDSLPRVRSISPALDAKHPELSTEHLDDLAELVDDA